MGCRGRAERARHQLKETNAAQRTTERQKVAQPRQIGEYRRSAAPHLKKKIRLGAHLVATFRKLFSRSQKEILAKYITDNFCATIFSNAAKDITQNNLQIAPFQKKKLFRVVRNTT
jgi:hypothetical protein